MAKLTGPLFSLGASGQIAKTLVFFDWKGLNVVRKYVVPTNPDTTDQQTQRGYLAYMVARIKEQWMVSPHPFTAADRVAYGNLASTFATPRTWFNAICKQGIDQLVATLGFAIYRAGTTVEAVDEVDVELYGTAIVDATAGDFWYGTSKTALIYSKTATVATDKYSAAITGLVTGKKYYIQFKPTAPASQVGADSGLYTGTAL